MYPINGFVYVKAVGGYWSDDPNKRPETGPYKILNYYKFFNFSESFYYDLEGQDIYYQEHELKPATKEEALYHKLTQHIKED